MALVGCIGESGDDIAVDDESTIESETTCVSTFSCDGPIDYCGARTDNCGRVVQCGGCEAPLTCGGRVAGVCGIPESKRLCTNGWCWENPLPFGINLTAVWASTPNDVWATGDGGNLLRNNGTGWRSVASGTSERLTAVWGSAANDVYVGGEYDYLRRWNGTSLLAAGAPLDWYSVTGITGTSARDVRVASGTSVHHFDGTAWTSTQPGGSWLTGIVAASPTSVYAFDGDLPRKWNGVAWLPELTAPSGLAQGWAASPTDLFAIDYQNVYRSDGVTWSTALDNVGDLFAIHGAGGNVFAGGSSGLHRFDGQTWSTRPTDAAVRGIWATGTNDAWAVGDHGRTYKWNGTAWTKQSGAGAAYHLDAAISVPGTTETWFLGTGAMRFKNGVMENHGELFSGAWYGGTTGFATSATNVWAAGPSGQFARWNGTKWTFSQVTGIGWANVRGMWGTLATNIYAVTDGDGNEAHVLKYDGVAWKIAKRMRGPNGAYGSLRAVAGTSANDVWVGGDYGLLHQWNGAAWIDRSMPGVDFRAMWKSPSGTIWAATTTGLYRRAPSATTFVKVAGIDESLAHVSGTSDTDVWATVGDYWWSTSRVVRYTGAGFIRDDSKAGQSVRAISVTPTTIWVAGNNGGILRKTR